MSWHEDRHITLADDVNETVRWFLDSGYNAVPTGVPGCAYFGILFARGNEPVRLVSVGGWVRLDSEGISVL